MFVIALGNDICFVYFVWLVVFNIRGREFGMSKKFELDNFATQPSVGQLDICRKDDLF